MFTVCPKCTLTLVVTPADLRAAQGYVRCGRCANVFNAIAALMEEESRVMPEPASENPEPVPESTPETEPAPEPTRDVEVAPEPAPAPQPESARAVEVEAEVTVPDVEEVYAEYEPPPQEPTEAQLEFDPTATNVSEIFVEPNADKDEATGTFETIVLETEEAEGTAPEVAASAPATEDVGSTDVAGERDGEKEEIEEELRSLVQRLEAQEAQAKSSEGAAAPAEALTLPQASASGIAPQEELEEEASRRAWVWVTGVVGLGIVLLGQVVHHYRNELAVDPRFNGPLTKIYTALGLALEPHWDMRAYEVHQLGADAASAGAGRLVVRASVKNSAPHPQPLPLLRVAVLDRFGNHVAARDVTPAAYLPPGVAANTPLRAGQRIDVEIIFVDPGRDAVGFEIDACLAARDGSVGCANSR